MSQVPEGFHVLPVLVTASELKMLRHAGCFLAAGTAEAALRTWAGLPESPYGLKAALRRARDDETRSDLQREQ